MYNFFEPEKAMSEEEIIDILRPPDNCYKQEQEVPEKVEKKKLSMREIYDNIIEVLIEEGKLEKAKNKHEKEGEEEGEDEKTSAKSAKCVI